MKIKSLLALACTSLICINVYAVGANPDYNMSSWYDSQPYVVAWFSSGYKLTKKDSEHVNKVSSLKAYEGNYIVKCTVRLVEGNFDKKDSTGYYFPSESRYGQAEVVKSYNNPFLNCEQYIVFNSISKFK